MIGKSLLWFAMVVVAAAQGPGKAAVQPTPHFIHSKDVLRDLQLPAPPTLGSLADEADLLTVLEVQRTRTPQEVELAMKADKGTVWDFMRVMGEGFSADRLPVCRELFRRLQEDLWSTSYDMKDLYRRPRPPKRDPRVSPCVPVADTPSYPSGHAFRYFVWASVLGELRPDLREVLVGEAHRLAWGRVLGGAHYPSDLVAGQRLAQRVVRALLASKAFHKALEACREELGRAG